jgi:hypothetical protein
MSDTGQTTQQTTQQTAEGTQGTTTSSGQQSNDTTQGAQGAGEVTVEIKSPLNEGETTAEAFAPDKLTLPEGMEKNEVYEEFTNFAKEAGFKHGDAQKLLDLSAKAMKANADAIYGAWHKQQTDWLKTIKEDPELGPNLEGLRQTFAKVADNRELSDPEFRKALDFTGAGTHPAIVRTLTRWAKALSEGGLVAGSPAQRDRQGSTVTEERSPAERVYGPSGPHTGGPKLG